MSEIINKDAIKNRYDFVLVFDVKDGNPNGDPDAGNLPRIDPETGHGLVTDVCLKRKVRNFVQITNGSTEHNDIYVKEKAVLGRAHFEVFKELGIPTGEESRKNIPQSLMEIFDELSLPEGISYIENGNEDGGVLIVAADAEKKTIKEWLNEEKIHKEISMLINAALKDAKPRKPTAEQTLKGRERMCEKYYDIRTFGAVLSLKSAPNCGQVRGPVQMTFGRSVEPIVTLEHSITRMAVATEAEAEKQQGDNRTMGRKNTVPYGVYVSYGFISPHLAAQTKFNENDLDLFWNSLVNMFEHDRSAARGLMSTQKLVVFKHDSALGNAPAYSLFDRISIKRKDETRPARSFHDYDFEINGAGLPQGVTIENK
ncbi:MAG: type I-C CRISPR-associated protein Cas7/Csd2 [Deltaproteobacteria bacterium]|uniref:type I-C CRISPR-associated protein Cas7/Csd2 n=1 Tax=Desulfobacula sp. TaxID=2593537 RepID=UPI00198A7005|nr:type I-C CRISPR-associated protein Cas7/Csd2 [Candidatus Desulfobacula maris]MBL6995237.1 type I-C CRISPR-associated protein Cas7/Csd2 [Desulfobacula sp.]